MSLHTNYLLWVIVGILITGIFSFFLYKREKKLRARASAGQPMKEAKIQGQPMEEVKVQDQGQAAEADISRQAEGAAAGRRDSENPGTGSSQQGKEQP